MRNLEVDLPMVFKVEVPDQAMAPRFKKGSLVEFTRDVRPAPGDGVLVRDSFGQAYFREYRQRRAGMWAAHAYNDAFDVLDAEADGLSVIGVLTGWSGRLSEQDCRPRDESERRSETRLSGAQRFASSPGYQDAADS